MRFIANENFPIPSLNLLRKAGHDVIAITEVSPSVEDEAILAQAVLQDRIILTFD